MMYVACLYCVLRFTLCSVVIVSGGLTIRDSCAIHNYYYYWYGYGVYVFSSYNENERRILVL